MELYETKIDGKTVYECPVFTVSSDTVRLPDGRTAKRERVHHNGGSGILPLTENDEIVLVEQYRYGVGQRMLEIPAGKLEKGEDPYDCAVRELREEVGAVAEQITPLGSIAVSPAYDAEIIYIYLASGCTFGEQHLDDDEFLKIHHVGFDKAYQMVLDGAITDAKTQIAILKVAQMKNKH